MNRNRGVILRSLALLLAIGLAVDALAVLPQTLNYQGRMTDPSGVSVPDSTGNTVTFRIFDALAGPTELWAEVYDNANGRFVISKNGLFNVTLGQYVPINLPFDVPYYLQIEWFKAGVGYETMTPRQPLTMAPYAYRAKFAESVAIVAPLSLTTGANVPVIYADSTATAGVHVALFGNAPTGGTAIGVMGSNSNFPLYPSSAAAIYGYNGSGDPAVWGRSTSGPFSRALIAEGGAIGISATASNLNSSAGYFQGATGVAAIGSVYGLVASGPVAISASSNNVPIYAKNTLGGGFLPAILGEASGTGVGVVGRNTATKGAGALGGTVWPDGTFMNGVGVHGVSTANNIPGVFGEGDWGVLGKVTRGAGNVGVYAQSTTNTGYALRTLGSSIFDGPGNTTTFNTYVSFTAGTNLTSGISLPAVWSAPAAYPAGILTATNTGSGHGIAGYVTKPGVDPGGPPSLTSEFNGGVYGFTDQTLTAGVLGRATNTQSAGVIGIAQDTGVIGWSVGAGATGVSGQKFVTSGFGGRFVADPAGSTGVAGASSLGLGGYFNGVTAVVAETNGSGTLALWAKNGSPNGTTALIEGGAIGLSVSASGPASTGIFAQGVTGVVGIATSGSNRIGMIGSTDYPLPFLPSASVGVVGSSAQPGGYGIWAFSQGGLAAIGTYAAGSTYGIDGYHGSATGSPIAVRGAAPFAPSGIGVLGMHGTATNPVVSAPVGVYGKVTNVAGKAVVADGNGVGLSATASDSSGVAVFARSRNIGVATGTLRVMNDGASGNGIFASGSTAVGASGNIIGVEAYGGSYGVKASTDSSGGAGIYTETTDPNAHALIASMNYSGLGGSTGGVAVSATSGLDDGIAGYFQAVSAVVALGSSIGVSATASAPFGVGIFGKGGSGPGGAGVIGVVSGTNGGFGHAGVLAQNTSASTPGNPAFGLEIDGAIGIRGGAVGTITFAASNTAILVNGNILLVPTTSMIFITARSGTLVYSVNVTANGQATITASAINSNTVNYLIINSR